MRLGAGVVLLGALALVAAGCSGGGGGGGSSRLKSGTHEKDGSVSDTDSKPDQFKIASVAGTVTASLTYDEAGGNNDLDIILIDGPCCDDDDLDEIVVLDANEDVSPGDSPAEVSGAVNEDMDVRIIVYAFTGEDVSYDITINVP